jgi:hypothetical protein
MAKTTIVCGMLLTLLGLITYFFAIPLGAEKASVTALIPTFVGVPLMLLGYLSVVKPSLRKHVMHVAVLLGLIGFLASAGRLVPVMMRNPSFGIGPVSLMAMAGICGVFVVMCVRSFVAARRAREGERGL